MASVRIRLTSSGIPRSKLRRPASTYTILIPIFAATRAQAMVKLTSPTTSRKSGRCSRSTGSIRFMISAVWTVWPPPYPQVDDRFGNAEFPEEQLRHLLIVVLTGMDEEMIDERG